MYNLLIDEPPLQVLPSLAARIGLNEAIFLQQLNYWLNNKKTQGKMYEGQKWIRNTTEEWCKDNFPFWDKGVVKRVIKNLENDNLILSTGKLNKLPIDRTKWYTINREQFKVICQSEEPVKRILDKSNKRKKARANRVEITTRTVQNVPLAEVQNVPITKEQSDAIAEVQNVPDSLVQSVPSITRDYTETTSNTNVLEGGKPQPSTDSDFPEDTPEWIIDVLEKSVSKIKEMQFTSTRWQSLLDVELQRKEPRITLEAFVNRKLESNPNLPPDQNTLFDTPACEMLLEKLAVERKAKGSKGHIKNFPSLACKKKYLKAAEQLNGTLEKAVQAGLEKGITDIPGLVSWVSSEKWLEVDKPDDSQSSRPSAKREISKEQAIQMAKQLQQNIAAGGA